MPKITIGQPVSSSTATRSTPTPGRCRKRVLLETGYRFNIVLSRVGSVHNVPGGTVRKKVVRNSMPVLAPPAAAARCDAVEVEPLSVR